MSISAIASQLYTVQSRQNIPLSTAFRMMVREDIAMRFSVYNLTRILTKSEFLASVAQTAFGRRTPMQRMQDEQERRTNESNERFKRFTVSSIATLMRKVNILENISRRNNAIITSIYNDLGSGRGQRRININTFTGRAARVPIPSRTVRGQLDQINQQLQRLSRVDADRRNRERRIVNRNAQRRNARQEQQQSLLMTLLSNPLLLGMMIPGLPRALSMGTIAATAYSALTLPKTLSNIGARLSGRSAYEDPFTEWANKGITPLAAGLGTYGAIQLTRRVASRFMPRRTFVRPTMLQATNTAFSRMRPITRAMGMSGRAGAQATQRVAGRATRGVVRGVEQLRKWGRLSPKLKGLAGKVPSVIAAYIVYKVAEMSNTVHDYTHGKIDKSEYRQRMIQNYDDLADNVGPTGMGALLGAIVGTAVFPGVGTAALAGVGATAGGLIGLISDIFSGPEDQDNKYIGTKLFELIHEDKQPMIRSEDVDSRLNQYQNTKQSMAGGSQSSNFGRGSQPSSPQSFDSLGFNNSVAGAEGIVQLAASQIGLSENDPNLKRFIEEGGVSVNDPAFEAWCASFVNSILNRKGFIGTGSKIANSFQNWGVKVDSFSKIKPGDIIVETNYKSATSTGGHVGIATGVFDSSRGMIEIIAGNYQDKVSKYFIPADGDVMIRRAPQQTATKKAAQKQSTAVLPRPNSPSVVDRITSNTTLVERPPREQMVAQVEASDDAMEQNEEVAMLAGAAAQSIPVLRKQIDAVADITQRRLAGLEFGVANLTEKPSAVNQNFPYTMNNA